VSGAIVPALAVAREASKRVGSKRKAREGNTWLRDKLFPPVSCLLCRSFHSAAHARPVSAVAHLAPPRHSERNRGSVQAVIVAEATPTAPVHRCLVFAHI
jgi:hypothetical protein